MQCERNLGGCVRQMSFCSLQQVEDVGTSEYELLVGFFFVRVKKIKCLVKL